MGLYANILSMNEKHGKSGQWIGLFYLTLSDISAVIHSREIKDGANKDPVIFTFPIIDWQQLIIILCFRY